MRHFSRLGTLTLIAGGVLLGPVANAAGPGLRLASNFTALLLSNSSQGFLGVGIRDVDNDRATTLKLKDPHGAEITSIDQDAPAFKSGLRVHDVVVLMNGQRVEGTEQFRRMLHEIPPGRTITLVAMRDGQSQNFNVQLADRSALVSRVFDDLESDPAPASDVADTTPQLPSHGHSNGLFGSLSRNRYYVGVDIQPLPTGLADFFGARNGVLVGNVFSNSPASVAGMRAADVIQKVNGQPIVTLSDWEKALRANRGKRVQVTIIRDRRELTLSMIAGATKTGSDLQMPDFKPSNTQTPDMTQNGVPGVDVASLSEQTRYGGIASPSNPSAGGPDWGYDPGSFGEIGGLPLQIVLEQQTRCLQTLMRTVEIQQMD
jgi:serine protease Do